VTGGKLANAPRENAGSSKASRGTLTDRTAHNRSGLWILHGSQLQGPEDAFLSSGVLEADSIEIGIGCEVD